MLTVVILVVAIFALIALLEVLNALFDAFHHGFAEGLDVQRPPGLANLLMLPALGFGYVLRAAASVSLLIHEASHALFQGLGFAKPQIVLCSNGGYAKPRPWSRAQPFLIPYAFGQWALDGFISMGPIIVASTLAYVALHFLAGLQLSDVAAQLAAAEAALNGFKSLPSSLGGLAHYLLDTLRAMPVWKIAVFGVIGVMLSPSMTASSVDFHLSRYTLPAYGFSVVAAALLLTKAPAAGLIMVGGGFACVVLFLYLRSETRDWPSFISSFGFSQILLGALTLAKVFTPSLFGLTRMLSASVLGLTLAALVLVGFMALMVVMSLLTLQLRPLWLMLKEAPGELKSIFEVFSTCEDCAMHFRGKCDGCGRTIEEIEAAVKAGEAHADLSAAAQEMMQRVKENHGAQAEPVAASGGPMLERLKARAQSGGSDDEGSMLERMRARAKKNVED